METRVNAEYVGRKVGDLTVLRVIGYVRIAGKVRAMLAASCVCGQPKITDSGSLHKLSSCTRCQLGREHDRQRAGGRARAQQITRRAQVSDFDPATELVRLLSSFDEAGRALYCAYLGARTTLSAKVEAAAMVEANSRAMARRSA